ncbi:germin-like protein subfamily 1 member 11 [Ipomoea triloba]|uniref:germin-like protein subfamily 1 member 11 n=1 Tax=Ipomoea triloba TaxID=35885 RepID=UPI00125CDAD3|nr:germin-like protein subfamily 1 member 11 [Ipomoea triloba]XP_031111714.1 germin-like protein subfamily 1 member 11 [Ipomoea triloba]XP_031111716.1 germin-like protein subfamily 1 member 11 [Ipomoea triloba]
MITPPKKNKTMAFLLPTTLAITGLVFSFAHAFDPSPLQDFCVAANDPKSTVFVNGRVCKDPKLVTPDDFSTSGLNVSGDPAGVGVTLKSVGVDRIAGLNTLGIVMARVDYESGSPATPHSHPRSSELILVLEGTLETGFITADPSNPTKNRLYAKTLNAGDVFVIPPGLLHYQANVGKVKAVSFNSLNSQNPGLVTATSQLFGSAPAISDDILSKAFRVDKETIELIRSKFA